MAHGCSKPECCTHSGSISPSDEGADRELTIKAKAMWSGPDLNPAFIATGLRFFDLENPEHRAALELLLSHLTIGRNDLQEDD